MNLLDITQAINENRKILKFLNILADEGRLSDIPGKIGKYYKKYDSTWRDTDGKRIYADPIKELAYCGTQIIGDWNITQDKFHVTGINHCDERFCMVCHRRKAYQRFNRLSFDMDNRIGIDNYIYLFYSFTLPNQIDGFRKTADILRKTITTFFRSRFGDDKTSGLGSGIYGTMEIKKSEDGKSWHPHVHLIVAYPKEHVSSLKLTKKGQLKEISFNSPKYKKPQIFDTIEVKQHFLFVLRKYFPNYESECKLINHELNLDKEIQIHVTQLEGIRSFLECSKYLVKPGTIQSPDDLHLFIIDSYKLISKFQTGIFRHSKEDEEAYIEYVKLNKIKILYN